MSYRKPPAYGKALVARRKLGERIGLLVVAVHDWEVGVDLASRPNVARVVVPEDTLPHELDWSPCVALDCLVCGDCPEPVFYAAVTMLHAAGAASIWGQFADGVARLEPMRSKMAPFGFIATDTPFPIQSLGIALQMYREWALMTRAGVYGTKAYAPARFDVFLRVFGEQLAQRAIEWVDKKHDEARAA